MIKNVTLGADPELFLERDGEIISAEGLIGGTKANPKKISDYGHFVQEDNIMIEFNIPPSDTAEDFVSNINQVKDYLEALATIQSGALNYSASAIIDEKYLQTDQALLFGCEPDLNVWERASNLIPDANSSLRTCGGHIHIGYDNPTQQVSEQIVKAMDCILGLESLSLDPDKRRRKMYGQAGAFRFKKYGVEYRTLSNFWITDDKLINWAYEKTLEAIELVNSGRLKAITTKFGPAIPDTINNNKEGVAKQILQEIKKEELILK